MGAKKKEIKVITYNDKISDTPMQKIESISLPETSKQTEFIEGSSDEIAEKLVEILKKEIKVI